MASLMPRNGTLIVRLGAIGDTVLTIPMIQMLIDRFPDEPLYYVGGSFAPALLRGIKGVSTVLSVDTPDLICLFDETNRWDDQFLARFGLPNRAIVILANPDTVVASLRRIGVSGIVAGTPVPHTGLHVSDHLATFVDGTIPAIPVLPVSVSDISAARAYAPEVFGAIVVAPGAGGKAKRWDGFADLVTRLLEQNRVVVVGGPADHDAIDPFRESVPVIDSLPLDLLPAALQSAALVVANDSGPGHIAAAVGTPVVSIFTVTDPQVWAPRGTGVVPLIRPEVEKVQAAVNRLQNR